MSFTFRASCIQWTLSVNFTRLAASTLLSFVWPFSCVHILPIMGLMEETKIRKWMRIKHVGRVRVREPCLVGCSWQQKIPNPKNNERKGYLGIKKNFFLIQNLCV